jgi:hypothetical protein
VTTLVELFEGGVAWRTVRVRPVLDPVPEPG